MKVSTYSLVASTIAAFGLVFFLGFHPMIEAFQIKKNPDIYNANLPIASSNAPNSTVSLPLVLMNSTMASPDACELERKEEENAPCIRPCTYLTSEMAEGIRSCGANLDERIGSYTFFHNEEKRCSQLESLDDCVMACMYGDNVRLNMKSYGNHNPQYDDRIIAMKPEYVVDNPAHGLYGEIDGYGQEWLLQNPKIYQDVGSKVIGYISGGYEGRGGGDSYDLKWYSLQMNKKLIRNMAELDHVDGIFIDECTAFPNSQSKLYLSELSGLARSLGLEVWMNVGLDDFDPWFFTVADKMQSTEAWKKQELTPVQKRFAGRIAVTGFNPSYNAQTAFDYTIDAWKKGIGYCYINSAEYNSIAPWFESYVEMLRTYQEQEKQKKIYFPIINKCN